MNQQKKQKREFKEGKFKDLLDPPENEVVKLEKCKYCKQAPYPFFDKIEEKYYFECCEAYKPLRFDFLKDATIHFNGFKKSIKETIRGFISS